MCVSVCLCHARLDHKRIHVRYQVGRYLPYLHSGPYGIHNQFPSQEIVMSTYLYLNIHPTFLPATKRNVPYVHVPRYLYRQKKIRFIKRVTKTKKRKCGGGKLPRYRYLPTNTRVMIEMNLEGGERKLTSLPVPTYTLHVRYVCTCTLPVLYGT